jgi:hypothetical protein
VAAKLLTPEGHGRDAARLIDGVEQGLGESPGRGDLKVDEEVELTGQLTRFDDAETQGHAAAKFDGVDRGGVEGIELKDAAGGEFVVGDGGAGCNRFGITRAATLHRV